MSQVYSMEVAGLQVIPLPPSFPLQIHRSTLDLVEPSIAPSTINSLKAAEVRLNLRIQGTLRNRWGQGIVGDLGFFRAEGAVIMGDRSGLVGI
jgi:hypothetical protein